MNHPGRIRGAITVDEIGIEYGRYGDLLVKTAYQPVFRRSGDLLRPFAVEGLIAVTREGQAVPPADLFRRAQASGDRHLAEAMCRMLHLGNYRNIGVPGLKLFLKVDPRHCGDIGALVADIDAVTARPDDVPLEPDLLFCDIAETEAQDIGTLARVAGEMRSRRIGLSIDDFGIGHTTLERMTLLGPDIVRIAGKWVTHLIAVPGAVRLLNGLVAGLQELGAGVLIDGIETPAQLRAALDAQADFLQGLLLARPQLAGTLFDETPRPADAYAEPPSNVVRLFRS
jgi:EAL domain-containing protein (putative c-di-GMP-specific phosphodiesterase class I)